MLPINKIHNLDCLTGLKLLSDNSIDCCVTSPPYFGLRDYGVEGQIGLEPTPAEFVARLVEIFAEVHRVLKPDGTVWVNLGDSYWGGKGKSGYSMSPEAQDERAKAGKSLTKGYMQANGGPGKMRPQDAKHEVLKPKDLVGIPWKFAFAMQEAGWWLRQDIIWSKPNPMPESVQDRCTRAHEYIFMFTKSKAYHYDAAAIRTPPAALSIARWDQDLESQKGSDRGNGGAKTNGAMKAVGGPKTDKQRGHGRRHVGFNERWDGMTNEEQRAGGANRRSVWDIATRPFSEAHFATFPPELPWLCIRAGCPPSGIVLDPFMGAGTTAMVAKGLGRDYIGFELNPDYVAIANKRLYNELGFVAMEGFNQ